MKMKNSLFVLFLFGALSATAQDKPNILVIWGDGIGWANVSKYNHGMMGYQTPNIDRIANEGQCLRTGTLNNPAQQDAQHLY